MRCPTLAELPPPPQGKTGWPWTEGRVGVPRTLANNQPWPRISIVTPSYNQGQYLEATIRSVLLQGYPNLEYLVIDGGSTDQSCEIIRKYSPWLADWVSEPDRGQADAINKGFARATGDIFGWLNSDDIYEPGSLRSVAEHFVREPSCLLAYGNGWYLDEDGHKTRPCDWIRSFDRRLYLTFNFILQPAAFWRRSLWETAGPLDASYHYAMDWEWFIRATETTRPHYLAVALAGWRIRPEIKTSTGGRVRRAEIARISKQYGGIRQPTYLVYHLDRLSWWMFDHVGDNSVSRTLLNLSSPLRWALKHKLWKSRYLT